MLETQAALERFHEVVSVPLLVCGADGGMLFTCPAYPTLPVPFMDMLTRTPLMSLRDLSATSDRRNTPLSPAPPCGPGQPFGAGWPRKSRMH